MHKPMPKKIEVTKCQNSILWYANHVGTTFDVVREEGKAYWVRELEFPFCLNWIYKEDCKNV